MGVYCCMLSLQHIMLAVLLFVPLVAGSDYHHHPKNVQMPAPLGQGTGNDQYKPVDPSYSTPDEVYKAGDKDDCHPVEEIVYENRCLPYVEKTLPDSAAGAVQGGVREELYRRHR